MESDRYSIFERREPVIDIPEADERRYSSQRDQILNYIIGEVCAAGGRVLFLWEIPKDVWETLSNSLEDFAQEMYYQGYCDREIEAGREAGQRTANMVIAMLNTLDRSEKVKAAAALSALAGATMEEIEEHICQRGEE